MRKIHNVDKTWDTIRTISPSDYTRYFFICLDEKSPVYLPDSARASRLDELTLNQIGQLINRKNTMFIYIEGDDEE